MVQNFKKKNKKRLPQCDKRFWCLEPESNQRHEDFQSSALPTELSRLKKSDAEGTRTLDLQRDRLAF